LKPDNWIQRINLFPSGRVADRPLLHAETFAQFYNETHLSVFRYIYGLTGGPPADVEDLCAETYLRAWKNRDAYLGEPQQAIGWALRIARNLVIDRYRRAQNRLPYAEAGIEDESLPGLTEQHPENLLIGSEQQAQVLNLLRQLSPEQREILTLRYLLGWKVQEIGRYLNIPENTVSVYIRRALEKLQSLWPAEKE
jgi:RNA polymerase sigma-70 factor (ECF subfamily)